ncbi:hypothetical protein CAEBREN_16554 [Caenorhabditis brenneri]|uniref:BTB domain-containing protein n=1 Tax=Caenorhabditis brenneri TaxID=135651 RepID=G0MUW2_CAEBE|nr:hypothetical protein CAEBREN_16554 [Caenorhabditis brenneri]
MTDKITLNVGGVRVHTTRTTLTRIPSWLNDLITSHPPPPLDEYGYIFIDRSPKHIGSILDYLRDGDVALPDNQQHVREILNEAIYYNVGGLIDLCNASIKIRIIENDLKMLQIIARSPRPVLIIHYGRMEDMSLIFHPPDTASKFESRYRKWFDVYFKQNTTPGIDPGLWSFSIHDDRTNVYTVVTAFDSNRFYTMIMDAVVRFQDNRNLLQSMQDNLEQEQDEDM